MGIPDSLIQQLVHRRIVPFVGSGVSLAVRKKLFPAWNELLGMLAERLQNEAKEDEAAIVRLFVKKGQLNKAADVAFEELGPARFREEMQAVFGVNQPPDCDLSLPTAIWSLRPQIVVTTNYDRVLQWSNPTARPVTNTQRGNLADLFDTTAEDKPLVWHVHGHIDDPDSLILAPQQYNQLYRDAADDKHPYAAARNQLRHLFANFPLLFIGFGLQDEYVMDAVMTMLEMFGGNLRPGFALLKQGEEQPRKLWEKYKIQVIEYSGYGDPFVELVRGLANRAADRAASGDESMLGPPVLPPAYVEWLADQCADVTPFGMAPAQGQSVSLHQVYVPPVTSSPVRLGDMLHNRGKIQPPPSRDEEESDGTSDDPGGVEVSRKTLLLHLLDQFPLYVSGGPGAGKSTFCRWVAWLAATGKVPSFQVPAPDEYLERLPDSLRDRLPLLVRLREFRDYLPAQDGRSGLTADELQSALRLWLDKTRPGGLVWADAAPYLAAGSVLLILDGVDELPLVEQRDRVSWSPRQSLLAGVTAAAPDWITKGNRILITSRPYGLTADEVRQLERAGLVEAQLAPLPEALQSLLASRWFVALPKTSHEGRQVAEQMLKQIASLQGDVASLIANPLLLTAICIIYGEGKELPKDKHNLYDRIVNTALHSRYLHSETVIAPVRARLAAVALGMHTGHPYEPARLSPAAEVTFEELDQILGAYIEATPETESGFRRSLDAREDLLSRSGLLSQAQPQRASFYHLSFQEFLAAERLVLVNQNETKLVDVFRQRASRSGWRPTLSFLFGRRVAQPGWSAGVDLLERIMAAVDLGNLPSCLGLALASLDGLEILLRNDLNLQPPLLDQFRRIALAAIEQQVELKPRLELALMLGQIGDPRVVEDLNDQGAWVEVAGGEYPLGDADMRQRSQGLALAPELFTFSGPLRISKFPITNAQFARFIAAGGYDDSSYWTNEGWSWRVDHDITEPQLWRDPRWNSATRPVVGVSWWEADAFCRWAECRLPTEREWEAAARGRQGREFPWGNDWRVGICNSWETGLNVSTPVGVFPDSAAECGAHDMAGNVWEWCGDHFDSWQAGDPNARRVLRGGSWGYVQHLCRSAVRSYFHPEYRGSDVGFRVART